MKRSTRVSNEAFMEFGDLAVPLSDITKSLAHSVRVIRDQNLDCLLGPYG